MTIANQLLKSAGKAATKNAKKSNIKSGEGSGLVRLYHGTDEVGAAGINEKGLIEGPVFLTPRKEIAEEYGEHVFSVEVPAKELGVDFDLPGARILDFDEAKRYAEKEWEDIYDAIDEGVSVATPKSIEGAKIAPAVIAATGGAAMLSGQQEAQAGQFTPEQQAAIQRAQARLGQSQAGMQAKFTPEQQAAIERAKARLTQQERPKLTARGQYGASVKRKQYDEQQALKQFEQIQAGQLSAADLPPEQVEAVRAARINAIPELSGISDKINFGQALAGMTAFDPEEFANIITSSDPDVGKVYTPDGQVILHNNRTGDTINTNKVGPSLMDAFQLGGSILAFAPSSKAATIPAMIASGMGTQALIESGQALAGGEFNPGEVALAGAAPVVMSKGMQAAKSGIRKLSSRPSAATQYLDDQIQGITKQDMALTPIEQQPRNTDFLQAVNQPVKETAKKAEIRQAMRQGDREAAPWMLNRRGQIVSDPVAKQAVSQGFDPAAVATIKFGSQADKSFMRQMLDIAERSLKNAKDRARNRPQQVIGNNVMKRFDTIKKANLQAGQDVGAAAKNELQGKTVDITDAFDSFNDDLANLGVSFGEGGDLIFKGSQIEGNKATTVIKRVFDRLKTEDDGLSLHKLKQYIDNQINWEKSPDKPLDKQAVNVLKGLREKINARLKEQSGAYADANQRYSTTVDALNEFYDVMGRRFDPASDRVNDAVGQELRKVLSNYGVRNDMILAIDKLDDVASQFGGQFDDDIMNQIVFYSDLEKVLGSFADNSLQGVSEKANLAVSAARGDLVGVTTDLLRSGVKKTLGRNEEKAIKSMRQLLSR